MAGDGFHAEPDELRGYSQMLDRTAQQFTAIEGHARDKGGDTSGFTGLLMVLAPVVEGVVGLYAQTLQYANRKMQDVRTNLDGAAKEYDERDRTAAGTLTTSSVGLDSVHIPTVRGGGAG